MTVPASSNDRCPAASPAAKADSPCGRTLANADPGEGAPPGPDVGTGIEAEEATEIRSRLDHGWNVVVWDDPVNLMSYVVYVFQKLLGFSVEQATDHMLEVHNDGRSLVATAARERGEFLVVRLHAHGLQATLERDEG